MGVRGTEARMSTLFVGNLAWGTTSETLEAKLGEVGTVVSCDTGTVRNGRTRGWAIVEMGSEAEANAAISQLDGCDVEGRNLTVRLDQKHCPLREGRGCR